MTWVRLDDGFWSHPRIEHVGNEAAGAFCRALSYCGFHLSDGWISPGAASYIAKDRVWAKLVENGLVEEVDPGYRIPNYLEFNPSKEKVEEERRKAAERKAKSRGESR